MSIMFGNNVPLDYYEQDELNHTHNYDRFSIYIIKNGSLRLSIDDKIYLYESPCVICLNHENKIDIKSNDIADVKVLSFSPIFININMTLDRLQSTDYHEIVNEYDFFTLRPFLYRSETYSGCIPLDAQSYKMIDTLLSKIGDEIKYKGDYYWSCRSRSLLMKIILLLEDNFEDYLTKDKPAITNNIHMLMANALEYIHLNYSHNIFVPDLCNLIKVSKTTLNKYFKKNTGFTVNDYINNYRLKVAMKSLRFTSLTINEISRDCGFNYDTYFIKFFTNKVGIPPSEFRRKAVSQRKKDFQNM